MSKLRRRTVKEDEAHVAMLKECHKHTGLYNQSITGYMDETQIDNMYTIDAFVWFENDRKLGSGFFLTKVIVYRESTRYGKILIGTDSTTYARKGRRPTKEHSGLVDLGFTIRQINPNIPEWADHLCFVHTNNLYRLLSTSYCKQDRISRRNEKRVHILKYIEEHKINYFMGDKKPAFF